MNQDEIRAILTICLLASFSDGEKHDRERDQIRQVAEGLSGDNSFNLAGLYQDVLLRRASIDSAVAALTNNESRQLAYEMAVCVCDADGQTSEKETQFLGNLRQKLFGGSNATVQANTQSAPSFEAQAASVAEAPLQSTTLNDPFDTTVALPTSAAIPHPAGVDALERMPAQASHREGTLSSVEMDKKIMKASILNGAIELLPENLSTLAIIPLQMRLVYQIGQNYGYSLDRGHIKDFIATLGVGLTSQYLEQVGRKLLGSLLGKGMLGGIGKQAVSSGMSFASTYALGHVANQYYRGNRQLSTDLLKQTYQRVMQEGKSLQGQYLPQIQETARGLNTAKVISMVRGK
jgi:uncharacterized protein (DUF697 family)/tellurite resistance protein